MIEMRWVAPPSKVTEPLILMYGLVLQYRFVQPTVDASGALCPGEWTAWRNVPTVETTREAS